MVDGHHKDQARNEALFRYGVIADLLHRDLDRGELREGLAKLASRWWKDPKGEERRYSAKTLEGWYYKYKGNGFEGLVSKPRKDRGKVRSLDPKIQDLILRMKQEDPGRSAVLIERELKHAGLLDRDRSHTTSIRRLLRNEGLSGPIKEPRSRERLRWQAARAGELWQGDAVHGPALFDPSSGRKIRIKIFALLDDRTRLITYMQAFFEETQRAFLSVLLAAIIRRGRPRHLLLDNHGSFTGADVQYACAHLDIGLHFTRPHDGPAKGKIERFFRTLRAQFLDRLDLEKVQTIDDLNTRLALFRESEYNLNPHAAHSGQSPMSVWEEDTEEIRWVNDPSLIEDAFRMSVSRRVRGDSTIRIEGRFYEVPSHFRGQILQVFVDLLRKNRFYLLDGRTKLWLRQVDPVANAKRRRTHPKPFPRKPLTGLNPVEDLLKRFKKRKEDK